MKEEPDNNYFIFEQDHARPHNAIISTKACVKLFPNFTPTMKRYIGHHYLRKPSKLMDVWWIEKLWAQLANNV